LSGATRRPPADPVNACLSLSYALLARTMQSALSAVGLDPWRGFFHAPRPGRPRWRWT
jgi:CRISPR-associated exonuclease Cas4/CRISPR-associated protein Cas1